MKQDKLEQFILENRAGFDDELPAPGNWDKIRENIRPTRRINWTQRMLRVAAAVVIFVATYIFIDYNVYNQQNAFQANGPQIDPESEIPVLVEARAYYSGQIRSMESEVIRIAGENSPVQKEIELEFEELDKVFEELKADLNDDAANQEVIEAMIQNYRIKLHILEEILLQLNDADQEKENDHEDKKIIM